MATVAAGVLLLIPLAPSAANAAHAAKTNAPYVTVSLQAAAGSGCPAGSTTVVPTESGTAFTLLYDQFQAYGGDFKNCQVVVKATVPSGWTYAVYEVDNRGFAQLEQGAMARIQMTSYFTGEPWTMSVGKTMNGPYWDIWQTTNTFELQQWAQCATDHFLNINNVVGVMGPKSSSAAFFSTDMSVSTIFRLMFRPC